MTSNDLLFLMSRRRALRGWVDMHTHLMANLAFSGKLIHGGPDVGSLLPADSQCHHNVRATCILDALGPDNCTHGGWGVDNPCGDYIRNGVIDKLQEENEAINTPNNAYGAPTFQHWPKWNDITHQKMWVDGIRRAHWGGLRVMVALAVHNQTLAAAVGGPDDGPMDDKGSAIKQINEIKAFVLRHMDFMEVADCAEDLRRIVTADKIAVVLGVEIDAIGNFHKGTNPTLQMLKGEIQQLLGVGVRYIFPIHVIDNKLGGTAVYQGAFNISNYREYGDFYSLQCSKLEDNITFRYGPEKPVLDAVIHAIKDMNFGGIFDAISGAVAMVTKLGIDPFRNPPNPPECKPGGGCWDGTGHMNSKSLTPLGENAIREMMKLGMMIDIDHMSQKSANRALEIAEAVPDGGYPLNSGHNAPRSTGYSGHDTEYQRTEQQLKRIAALRGMFGLGTDRTNAETFRNQYNRVLEYAGSIGIGIGTDTNGMAKAPAPRPGSNIQYNEQFPMSRYDGMPVTWNYNGMLTGGVAHYGMFPDFLRDVESLPGGAAVKAHLFRSADGFARMWERCESQKTKVG